MKISLKWIRDYVSLPEDIDPNEIAHRLTLSTVEVEQVVDLSTRLAGCVVARVLAVCPHPNDARLHLVELDTGEAERRVVVCGAQNVAVGMKVALAMPGAQVRNREGEWTTLRVADVRGVESPGMLCAGSELDLADLLRCGPHDIADLSERDVDAGLPLAAAIGYDDFVLDIDNKSLTNRPDLWGHYGVARELAALYELPLVSLPRFSPPADPCSISMHIADPARCMRYTATTVRGLADGPAPFWMRSRLARVGQRPISLLVDLTNYVMMATGQPSHAFDARDVPSVIEIRTAAHDEKIVLLDGNVHTLDEDVLVIANHERPIALAGIMGGAEAIRADTQDMLLEVATFAPTPIRRTGRRYSVRTESSARFEKGIDTARVEVALGMFQALLGELQPQAVLASHRDVYPNPPAPIRISVGVAFLHRRLGKSLPAEQMCALLERLGFEAVLEGEQIQVGVPPWRATGDVSVPEDIVEEVARLYGYEELGFVPPQVTLSSPVIQPRRRMGRRLKEALAFRMGFQEVISYPWVSPDLLAAAGMSEVPSIELAEPPVADGRLAPSLVPQMLGMITDNLRWAKEFRLFEMGRVFRPGEVPTSGSTEVLPQQPRMLCAALVGASGPALFYEAKGIVDALPRVVQIGALSFAPGAAPWSEATATLAILHGDERVGTLGVVSARAKRLAGIRQAEAVLIELDVDALVPHASRENRYIALPRHPLVTKDVSVILDSSIRWEQLEALLADVTPALRKIEFVDEYIGPQVPADHRSLTLRLTLGADDHTLSRKEIDDAGALLTSCLEEALGGQIR